VPTIPNQSPSTSSIIGLFFFLGPKRSFLKRDFAGSKKIGKEIKGCIYKEEEEMKECGS
jgi:hypothetical protein